VLLAASLLEFGGDRREMPVEFSLWHVCDVNREFGETLMYVCELFAGLAVHDAIGIEQNNSKMIRILRFVDGVAITVADFGLWGTCVLISQSSLVESACSETRSDNGV
jgi:hypothetical protein